MNVNRRTNITYGVRVSAGVNYDRASLTAGTTDGSNAEDCHGN